MLDPSAGFRLAATFNEIALAGMKAQMSLFAIGPEIALRAIGRREPAPTPFIPFAPAVWSPSRRSAPALPPASQMSLAFWQGWFRYAEAMRGAAPMWPAFASGSTGSGHAGQMMGEIPRLYMGYQPGVRSPVWPWSAPAMLTFAVTVPPMLEAMMAGWGKAAFAA